MKRTKDLVNLEYTQKSNKLYVNNLLKHSNKSEIENLPKDLNLTHKDLIPESKLTHVKRVLSDEEYILYIKKNYRLFNFFKETSFLAIIYFISLIFLFALSFYADDVDHVLFPSMIAFPIIVASFSILEIQDFNRLLSYRKEIKKLKNQ